METQVLVGEIDRLCEEAKCSEKLQRVHREQYILRRWNPHPPQPFVDWWRKHPDFKNSGGSLDAKLAYNCQQYRDEFRKCHAVIRAA